MCVCVCVCVCVYVCVLTRGTLRGDSCVFSDSVGASSLWGAPYNNSISNAYKSPFQAAGSEITIHPTVICLNIDKHKSVFVNRLLHTHQTNSKKSLCRQYVELK